MRDGYQSSDKDHAQEIEGGPLVNVKATLSPDDLARACADAMWKEDDASSGLGMKIVEIGSGRATLSMKVAPYMVNGQRIAHGEIGRAHV